MPCFVVCMCSSVKVTPMNNLNKQICTPVMFLYVLCVAVQMVSRSLVQHVNLYAIPQPFHIFLSFGLDSLTYVPNVFESGIQLCSK